MISIYDYYIVYKGISLLHDSHDNPTISDPELATANATARLLQRDTLSSFNMQCVRQEARSC